MTRNEKIIVALTSSGHALTHGYLLIYPAVLLLIQKEFSLGYLGLGIVGSLPTLTYGIGALPAGIFCDWLGHKRIFIICFLGSALSSLMIALSSSFHVFAVGMTLLGVFGSLYHPMANALVTSQVREMGKAVGIQGAAGNIGLALTPFIAAFIASHWGWRTAYLCAVFPGFFLPLWAFFVHMSLKKSDSELDGKMRTRSGTEKPSTRIWFFFALPLVLLYVVNGLNSFCYHGTITFLPAYIARKTTFTILSLDNVAIGGMLSSIVLFLGLFGQYAGGMRAQRKETEGSLLLAAIISFPFVLAMFFTDNILLLLTAFAYFFLNFSIQPMANVTLARYTPQEVRGTAFGIFFSIGFGISSVGPSLSGYLAENFGLNAVFLGMGGGVLVLIFFAIWLARRSRRLYLSQDRGH
jgi:MFS family permease